MIYLGIIIVVIPSPVFMFISSEAIAIFLSLKGYSPLLIALSLAVGQSIGFTSLFFFGEHLCKRWDRLQRKLDTFDVDAFSTKANILLGSAAFFGLPPLNLSSLVSSTVGVSYYIYISLVLSGRFIRYWLIASIPQYFENWFDLNLLPEWVQNL